MIYEHWTDYDEKWNWKNFSPEELSCPCCGEYYHDPVILDMIQESRDHTGRPLIINSAHRCVIYNSSTRIGGKPWSEHKKMAFDISTIGHNRFWLLEILKQAGFTTFGKYQTFIHTDKRSNRLWYGGKKARVLWTVS